MFIFIVDIPLRCVYIYSSNDSTHEFSHPKVLIIPTINEYDSVQRNKTVKHRKT